MRDTYDLGDKVVIVTTDRQSAFDRLLASIPFKGQVGGREGRCSWHEAGRLLHNCPPGRGFLILRAANCTLSPLMAELGS